MKNNLNVAFVLSALMFCVLGCGSTERAGRETPKFKPSTTTPRILVQSEPKGVTGVYLQDLRVLPELSVDGKTSPSGEHEFTLYSSDNYAGKKPSCDAKSLVLSISHTTVHDTAWRFPASSAASVVIDGSPTVLKVYSQMPYEMPAMAKYMKDPEASETMIISAPCELYQRLSKASTIEFRIGNGAFSLSPEGVKNFRDFAEAIGYK